MTDLLLVFLGFSMQRGRFGMGEARATSAFFKNARMPIAFLKVISIQSIGLIVFV